MYVKALRMGIFIILYLSRWTVCEDEMFEYFMQKFTLKKKMVWGRI